MTWPPDRTRALAPTSLVRSAPLCVLPDFEVFARLHRQGISLPVLWDCADPGWEPLALAAALPESATVFLLESPGGPPDLERRTFLSWDPEREFVLCRGRLETSGPGLETSRSRCRAPLAALRQVLRTEGAAPVPYADGWNGGLVGYLGYDCKNYLERLPDRARDDLGTPELRFGLVRRLVSWEHDSGRMQLRVNLRCRSVRARDDWKHAHAALEELADEVSRLQARARSGARRRGLRRREPGVSRAAMISSLRSNLDREAYDAMLARAHEHILEGDIYQANLSHRFESRYAGDGLDLYRHLRSINPSPFATYMRFPDHILVSCSPERLVQLENGRVSTRPIAGTRPRGDDRRADQALERELLASEKERAEHLMIVDMARNDIGRVCEIGSVEVQRFMNVERYSHVRHLVSNVVGRLRRDRDAFDLLAAVFPGASVTGVPKIRCMQIIDSLETQRRGVYTGSAGYFGLDGNADFNILIRTFLLQNGRAYFHVGGGIVADSEAESEYQETLAKARALLEALWATAGARHTRPGAATVRPARRAAATLLGRKKSAFRRAAEVRRAARLASHLERRAPTPRGGASRSGRPRLPAR